MNLRTYTAASMAEVLTLVKQDLGPDAIILHTRTYRRGGFLGLGPRPVVEITATDDTSLGRSTRRRAAAPQSSGKISAPPRPSSHQATTADLVRRTYEAAKVDLA